jgi:hypothetical protein
MPLNMFSEFYISRVPRESKYNLEKISESSVFDHPIYECARVYVVRWKVSEKKLNKTFPSEASQTDLTLRFFFGLPFTDETNVTFCDEALQRFPLIPDRTNKNMFAIWVVYFYSRMTRNMRTLPRDGYLSLGKDPATIRIETINLQVGNFDR